MQSIARIHSSDETGNAAIATVQTPRLALATTIVVDTVENIPATFYGSMGTPHTFIDPITSEEIVVISEATAVDFAGHVDSTDLIIDTIAPGYTDAGSAVGDIVIIRPTSQWADNVANVLEESHNDDGTLKNNAITTAAQITDGIITNDEMATAVKPVTLIGETSFDFVASGCVWTADAAGSTRVASMTAGVVYIAGKRLTVAAVVSRTFTASKDVYVDLKDNGDGTAVPVYYDNTTNAASPSFATTTGTLRIAIIVVGASSIAAAASINQGQKNRVLPIASSIPYSVTDSLGNLICNRNPNPTLIGYRQILTDFGTASTSFTQVTGLSVPFIIPSGTQNVKATFTGEGVFNSGTNSNVLSIWDGTVGSGTQLGTAFGTVPIANKSVNLTAIAFTEASGSKTYNAGLKTDAGTATISATAAGTTPTFLAIERV